MTDPAEALADAEARAKAATTPTTFNFAAAVLDRSYPEIDVPIYLDEKSIQSLLDVFNERAELETRIAAYKGKNSPSELANKFNELTEKYDALRDSLKEQEYIVRIKGIAPEESQRLEESAYEAFPKEFREDRNPMTGAIVRTEEANDKRDGHFADLIRQAHLVSITAPNGAVDSDFADVAKVHTMFARMPLLARAKVDEAINASTIQVDFYRELVDEVF